MKDTRYCAMEVKDCTNCSGGSYPLRGTCPVCGGEGKTLTPVPLRKVLKELGYITWRQFSYIKFGAGKPEEEE